ncbi:MAG: hypothetical protein FK730_13465 [Asgard group archaeon]|nr:hypothetical protein [Asgard group archaeon]
MKKQDFDLKELFSVKKISQNFHEERFNRLLPNTELQTEERKKTIIYSLKEFFRKLWYHPESRIIILLILSRLVFLFFTHWGMDFDFYIEIAQRVLAGEKLYIDIESTHMPLADLFYVSMYFICPWKNNIIAVRLFMKFPYLLTDIGIALAVMKIIENEKRKTDYNNQVLDDIAFEKVRKAKIKSGYFVAFSLPLILQTGGGRYDSLLIFCFAMTILCMQKNNYFGVAFYAALGSSAKYIGIIFLPFIILWLKKEDFLPFIFGLILGFIPIYPFLITIPGEFVDAVLLRGSHIAYGFSIWHAILIIWSGFKIKFIGGISDTYASQDEPWFIQRLYLPMFVIIYLAIFILYIIRYRKQFRVTKINDLPLNNLISLVFIPLFIFSLSFKAINIQVLAWFTPYFALRNKKSLLIVYSILTLVNGLALIFYEASINPSVFLGMSQQTAAQGSIFYLLIVNPAIRITQIIPSVVWVAIMFGTILWFYTRTTVEFISCTKEFVKE